MFGPGHGRRRVHAKISRDNVDTYENALGYAGRVTRLTQADLFEPARCDGRRLRRFATPRLNVRTVGNHRIRVIEVRRDGLFQVG